MRTGHADPLRRTIVWAAVLLALLSVRLGAQEPTDDPMLRGLQKRGLTSLVEAYQEQKTQASEMPGGAQARRAGREIEKALATRAMAQRDAGFQQACLLYEQAVAEAEKALPGVPADQWARRQDLRLQILKWRVDWAQAIFRDWLKGDLEILEVTDRRGGDRQKTARLLQVAQRELRTVFWKSTEWLSEIDRSPDSDRFENAGYSRELRQLHRDADYYSAWIAYYYAWVLPEDWKPPEGGRSRPELLNDAIAAFQEYLKLPDRVPAKWYAYMVTGLAHRERGEYEKALDALANADNASAPEPLKIRVAFERALTLVRQGKYAEARSAIETAREFFGEQKIQENLYGSAMALVEAESYWLEAQATGRQDLKDKGLGILQTVSARPDPWPAIVSWLMVAWVGQQESIPEEPFSLWILANDAYERAQQSQDTAELERALRLFQTYAEKVGPKDENYPAALYSQAACLLQLERKGEAADLFRRVADSAPKYQYAAEAAKYYVSALGQLYEASRAEEDRQRYEEALGWFVSNWLPTDPDQRYFYGLVLYRGGKYPESAEQFAQVPKDSEYYPDARYWVPLCRLEEFREKILPADDKAAILSRAREVVKELVEFADYAIQAKNLPESKQKQVLGWAETAYFSAADIYMYPQVELPNDALGMLDQMTQKFTLSQEMQGRVLKLRIEALQKLGRFDQAQEVLEKFLAVADPQEVGPVLRGLFQAMIDDVNRFIQRGDTKAAQSKVEGAQGIGKQLIEWLQTSSAANKAVEIENIRYDLAELYLAVADPKHADNYERALAIYREIGGETPEQPPEGQAVKVDCVYGMARAYEGLGEGAPDATQAKPYFERALRLWRTLLEVEEARRDSDPERIWTFRYQIFYCRYQLGERDQIRDDLDRLAILTRPQALGGSDPVLRKKFQELRALVSPSS